MEKKSGSVAEQAAIEMDEMLKGVMPSTWAGHGRIKIAEQDLSTEQKTFARRLHARLSKKHSDKNSVALAEKAIEKATEAF